MRSIDYNEFQSVSKNILSKIFTGADAYSSPFTDQIQPRLLLYYFSPVLHEPWIKPLVKTMKTLGERGFYISLQTKQNAVYPFESNWYVPINEIESYGTQIFPLENKIYSETGAWGIISSEEGHAILGGTNILINNVKESVPDMAARVKEFITLWKNYHAVNHVEINWILDVLVHVFGTQEAEKILKEADLFGLSCAEEI